MMRARNARATKSPGVERFLDAMAPVRHLFDGLVGIADPERALARERARQHMALLGSNIGASRERRATREWQTSIGDANADTLQDLPTLRTRSRDLARNSPLATGALNTVVTSVVGTGLTAHPNVDAEALGMDEGQADAWNTTADKEWRLFCESKDCDLTRTQNFYELQGLIFRSTLESGDVFSMLPMKDRGAMCPYWTRIQVIEGDRVSNKDWARDTSIQAGGVKMDTDGAPIAYQITRQHPGAVDRSSLAWDEVAAFAPSGRRRVLHHFDRRRPGQSRGIPYLSPVIESLKQLDRYTEAEIMAAVISGMFTVFITTENGEGTDGLPPSVTGAEASASETEIQMGSGAILDLAPGEKVESANPGRPNSGFDPFVQAILRQIGVALELPFEVLIKHFTASYSAARAALLEAWRFYRARREWMVGSFCEPVYEAWMDEAVALGRLDAPGFFDDPAIRKAYLRCSWTGDAAGSLDPVKEVTAAKLRVELGTSNLAKECVAQDGDDWKQVRQQRARELRTDKVLGLVALPPDPALPPVPDYVPNPDALEVA